jgi:hypothetical protein
LQHGDDERMSVPSVRYRGPPMTLANMRAQGVRSLWVVCELCHHEAVNLASAPSAGRPRLVAPVFLDGTMTWMR